MNARTAWRDCAVSLSLSFFLSLCLSSFSSLPSLSLSLSLSLSSESRQVRLSPFSLAARWRLISGQLTGRLDPIPLGSLYFVYFSISLSRQFAIVDSFSRRLRMRAERKVTIATIATVYLRRNSTSDQIACNRWWAAKCVCVCVSEWVCMCMYDDIYTYL